MQGFHTRYQPFGGVGKLLILAIPKLMALAKTKNPAPRPNPVPAPEKPKTGFSFAGVVKQVLLTLLSVLIIFLVFKPERNAQWLKRVKSYYTEYKKQKKVTDWETKMMMRHGNNYAYPQYIRSKLTDRDTFFLPPTAYLRRYEPGAAQWGSPNYFYYMAGKIPTVALADTARWYTADYTAIYNENRQLSLIPLQNKEMIDELIKEFSKP